jgi:hypothetical protein
MHRPFAAQIKGDQAVLQPIALTGAHARWPALMVSKAPLSVMKHRIALKAVALAAVLGFMNIMAPTEASASILNLEIGAAQIFDVQYNWSSTTGNASCGYADPAACDTLNVHGLQAPYESVPDFSTHPSLTTGQYYGFFVSTTVANTFGMAVFNTDGTEAYAIHNSGSLQKLSSDGIFYLGNDQFGTVITPNAGFAYGATASLAVGTGSPTYAEAMAFTPPSSVPLTVGQTPGTPTDAPEPASIALIASALVGIGATRKRSRLGRLASDPQG